mgnify:CR=1 FL=1
MRYEAATEDLMRQTFTFAESTHKPPQALAHLKSRIRKYIKRELRKPLEDETLRWEFDCRVGPTEEQATETQVSDVIARVDDIFHAESPTVYVEILARPGVKPVPQGFTKR